MGEYRGKIIMMAIDCTDKQAGRARDTLELVPCHLPWPKTLDQGIICSAIHNKAVLLLLGCSGSVGGRGSI